MVFKYGGWCQHRFVFAVVFCFVGRDFSFQIKASGGVRSGSMLNVDYSQPPEYHFSQDSTQLAQFVREEMVKGHLATGPSYGRVLDLCAGCGVVGFELLHGLAIQSFDFLEVQSIFYPHWQANAQKFNDICFLKKAKINWIQANYDELLLPKYSKTWDLIVCNPPYFFLDQGKLPKGEVRLRCHFFKDSDLQNLWLGITNALKPQGRAYVLTRELQDHRRSLVSQIQALVGHLGDVQIVEMVRGTHLLRFINSLSVGDRIVR